MDLVLVGLSHKTAPIGIRERIAFPDTHLRKGLCLLKKDFALRECMIVSTCNRVEVIAHSKQEQGSNTVESIKNFLYSYHALDRPFLEHYLYSYLKHDAVRHIFRVASSLDSMVVGEPQILAQLKRAYNLAHEVGNVGANLNHLIPRAFFVAKRVRSSTKIGASAVSVSSVAVELARKIFGDLHNKSILLLGAGKMGELAARSLAASGVNRILVANRSRARALEMASQFDGEVVSFENIRSSIISSDIMLTATGSNRFLIKKDLIEATIRERKYRPLFIIDIAVPRNVEPQVNEIENTFLYDIDDLQSISNKNRLERNREAEIAEDIVEEEVLNFKHRQKTQSLGPLIGSLQKRIEDICLEELKNQQNILSSQEYQRLEKTLRKTAKKIAHPLVREIKRTNSQPGQHYLTIELVKKMFQLKN